jgi:hypothetical protein
MIIDNFDVLRSAISPDETDSPLLVDSDAMLTSPIADQSLHPVSRNHRHIFQFLGVVEHSQFPSRYLRDIAELSAALSMKQLLGVLAAEGPNHIARIPREPLNEDYYTPIA